MRKVYVFGRPFDTDCYEYYAGRDPAGRIKWEQDYLKAAMFTDETLELAEEYLNAGYLVFCASVPDSPRLANLNEDNPGCTGCSCLEFHGYNAR